MTLKKLSILIPAYNEADQVYQILSRINAVSLINSITKEVIFIDDKSTDNTIQVVNTFAKNHPEIEITLYQQDVNKGKGAAIRKGIELATGEYLIIQDADLEYDPEEYNDLLKPVFKADADVVYGSRFMGGNPHRILFFWHSIGNKFLTILSNLFTDFNLTDMETCYKLFRSDIIKKIPLRENRFGFEPEITAKISKFKNLKLYEVGISYYGRTYDDGKKISWKDGVRAIYCILKYGMLKIK
ncbi:glycosyltransferase [Marinifilum sp. N1E240]|uniref:glycosyltransferase family 2 protein n=1 Tax=Marinifilum sp. N1E240 TaxID=2608082 RepID=UPI00128C7793|nr:glycosyltransferase family 2 protein [Marinifilum sp. N1E240]MPQ48669.1 glycosyltransferase [Marinifilum sp. N1E240]